MRGSRGDWVDGLSVGQVFHYHDLMLIEEAERRRKNLHDLYAAITAPHDKEARFRDQDKRLQESASRRPTRREAPMAAMPSEPMNEAAAARYADTLKNLPADFLE